MESSSIAARNSSGPTRCTITSKRNSRSSTGVNPSCEYALFSRPGFKSSVEEATDDRTDLRLFDLNDGVGALETDKIP